MRKTHTIHPTLTPGRRAWLELLQRNGTGKRGRGPVGCQCMRLGWTEWVRNGATGLTTGMERLTPAGEAMLNGGAP